jgi:hypothetical protein
MSSTVQMLPQERCPMNFSNPNSTERHYPTSRPAVFLLPISLEASQSQRSSVTKGDILFGGDEVQHLSPNELVRRGCIQVMEGRHTRRVLHMNDL